MRQEQSAAVMAPLMIIAHKDHLCVVTVPIFPDSRMAATTAEPREPPILYDVCKIAVPVPTREGSSSCVPTAVVLERTVAIPIPAAISAGSIAGIDGESPAVKFIIKKPKVKIVDPVAITPRKPFLSANRPASRAIKTIVPGITVNKRPVLIML